MRWFGLAWTLVAVAACTSPNPDFDGEAGPIPMEGTDGGSGNVSTSPSSGLVTTDSASASGTGVGTTGDEGPASDSSGLDPDETGATFDVSGGACTEDSGLPFMIRITDAKAGHLTPDCEPFDVTGEVTVNDDGAAIDLEVCGGDCPCADQGEQFTITFGEAGAVPDIYGGCRNVRLWAAELEGVIGCEWVGFSVAPSGGGGPLVIGCNARKVDVPDLGQIQLDFGEGEQCSDRSCSDSTPPHGNYALSIDGVEVWPEDPLTTVMLLERDYDFDNRSSHVTQECQEHVSWWAELR